VRTDLLIVDDFMPPQDCRRLTGRAVFPAPGRHDVSALHVMGRTEMHSLADQVGAALAAHFEIPERLHCDYAAASKSGPGMGHVEHADSETLDGDPSHTPWRTVTAMIYLNTQDVDFGGGDLTFTRLGVTIAPKAGLLVGFRCDGIHTHKVPPVTWGERRALAFWYTTDPAWAGRLRIQA
jgi:predicted 2-oxoglutarate/Fe(II)-dependent dioxygenase YbiX